MQIGLNANPLIPLFPLQPDRQATYPKALGPVFVGNPYLTFPKAAESAPQAGLQPGIGDRPAAPLGGLDGQDTFAGPGHPGTRSGPLGSILDVLA